MEKFIAGDEIDIGNGLIRQWWGTSPDGQWVWHSSPHLIGGRTDAEKCKLHSRAGFRVGDKATCIDNSSDVVYRVVQLDPTAACLITGEKHRPITGYFHYDRLRPFVAPEPPKWEAKEHGGVMEVTQGTILVAHFYNRDNLRAEHFANEYVAWKNSREAPPGQVAVGRRVREKDGDEGVVRCIEDGETCYRIDSGGFLTAMTTNLTVIDEKGVPDGQ